MYAEESCPIFFAAFTMNSIPQSENEQEAQQLAVKVITSYAKEIAKVAQKSI
jgi:hypothetical protein